MKNLDLSKVTGIPVELVDSHEGVFKFWRKFQDADLLHIDGHDDMSSGARFSLPIPEYYHTFLNAGNFICPAYHYGFISSIYWLNPHSEKRRLQDFGAREPTKGRERLETCISSTGLINWIESGSRNDDIEQGKGKVILPSQIHLRAGKPFILDIDLDAFSCCQQIQNTPKYYRGVDGYKKRIELTGNILSLILNEKRPELITIATSQSVIAREYCFVPLELVDDVRKKTLEMLSEVYRK